jgi:hypothetical protein
LRKPLAVERRDIISSTGPSIFGIQRMNKVKSPQGEVFTFLGVKEGEVYLERDDKTKGEPFAKMDSSDFMRYTKI